MNPAIVAGLNYIKIKKST